MAWIDAARGIGIVLVVVGHVLVGLRGAALLPDSPALLFVHRWIYAFHMPLFFFLSGLLAARPIEPPPGAFLAAKLETVAYPYAVWSVLQALVLIAFSPLTRDRPDASLLLRLPYRPLMQLWFLYTLFLIAVLYALLRRMGVRGLPLVAFSLGLYALPAFVRFGWDPLQSTAVFFVYFAAGAWLSPALATGAPRTAGAAWPSGLLALALLTAAVSLGLDGSWAARPLVAALGIAAISLLAGALDPAGPERVLHAWGRLSLPIYVAHLMAVIGCRVALRRLGVESGALHAVAGVAVGLGAPVLLARLVERAGWRTVFAFRRP